MEKSSPRTKQESDQRDSSPEPIRRQGRRGKSTIERAPVRHSSQGSPSVFKAMPLSSSLQSPRARESRTGLFGSDGPMIKTSWKKRQILDESDEESDIDDNIRADPTADSDEDSEEPRPPSPPKPRGASKRGTKRKLPSSDEEENDVVRRSGGDSDLPPLISKDDATKEDDSSDGDDTPIPPSTSKRRRLAPARSSRPRVLSDSEEDEVNEESEGEADSNHSQGVEKRDMETAEQSKRRRQEEEDLAEDLEFLESSPPPRASHGRGARSSQPTPKKSKKLSALEELRRRRMGNAGPSSSLPLDEEEEVDGSSAEDEEAVEIGDEYGDNLEDDDFVVEDDPDDPIGAPDIPLEFTRIGTAKAKDLFRYAVAWMVQKKLNPRFNMDEEIYRLAFRKLSDQVKGLAGSKFTSSVWNADFTRALHARPGIVEDHVGTEAFEHCQACNRKTHPATWTIRFEGKPYDPNTLDELYMQESTSSSDDSDDDESDEEDNTTRGPDRDFDGNELVPESRLFYVGVHCKANATTAHTLTHWKMHLYEWVVDHLAQLGHLDPPEIVRRDRWSDRKKEKFANRVAKAMVAEGEVKRLYRDFQHNVSEARNAKVCHNRTVDAW